MNEITILAHAKINLALDIVKKRTDGYHEICSIMQSIGLSDVVSLRLSEETAVMTNIPALNNQKNLAYKAAQLYGAEAFIKIEKNIPFEAGLGGASADAAAVLFGLNELCKKYTNEELFELAAQIGSDVPFFLMGGTVLSSGRGEILKKLSDFPGDVSKDYTMVIVKPPFGASTKEVYGALRTDLPYPRPNIQMIIDDGISVESLAANGGNSLEHVTIKIFPEIQDIKDNLTASGAVLSLMSGSGSSVYGIFEDARQAVNAAERLSKFDENRYTVHLAKPKNESMELRL